MRIALIAVALALIASGARADPLTCDLTEYKARPGLTAEVANNALAVTWDGNTNQELRLRLTVIGGTPTISDLAMRPKGAQWTTLASNVTPEFRVVSGMRRMSNQQLQPLRGLGVNITPELVDKEKWEAFWDAPLDVPGLPAGGRGAGGGGNLPPDLPRQVSEIHRATASYHVSGCQVKTNGARLEMTFSGMELGVFSGRLQYTVYKGINLIRQEAIAKTDEPSVAYKYDAGLKGLPIQNGSRLAWRDTANNWQTYRFGGNKNENEVALKASNRLLIAEQGEAGSIAAFPPPHTFFWARELATNLGYTWYRKDSDRSFSFGIRQAEHEDGAQYQANFALYSARPGTWQRMPVYFYVAGPARATLESVLALTHGDHYKPLPGYQVMNHHYHMDLGQRLGRSGSLDTEIPDLEALKALGINIVSQIDSVGSDAPAAVPGAAGGRGVGPGTGRGDAPAAPVQGAGRRDTLQIMADSVEGARRHSDKDFLVMPRSRLSMGHGAGFVRAAAV